MPTACWQINTIGMTPTLIQVPTTLLRRRACKCESASVRVSPLRRHPGVALTGCDRPRGTRAAAHDCSEADGGVYGRWLLGRTGIFVDARIRVMMHTTLNKQRGILVYMALV